MLPTEPVQTPDEQAKNITIGTLLTLGKLMRGDQVSFNVNGEELERINLVLNQLQTILNRFHGNEWVITDVTAQPDPSDDLAGEGEEDDGVPF